jgi:stage II sporulation protein AA (anti-sigma F factor antagonist)
MAILLSELSAGMVLVQLDGPLTSEQAEAVKQTFQELAEKDVKRIVVSLEKVPFLDSRGLVALMAGYRLFGSANHDFRVAAVQEQPKLVFDLTGFNHIFQIYKTVAEAAAIEADLVPALLRSTGVHMALPA